MTTNSQNQKHVHLAIAATFTAEPIEIALEFWLEKLGIPYSISFAPYNQVFQQLVDKSSLFSLNQDTDSQKALNILLIRLEDWPLGDLEQNTNEFIETTQALAAQQQSTFMIGFCHSSPSTYIDPHHDAQIDKAEQHINEALRGLSNVSIITRQEINTAYPVTQYHDPITEKTGHIPYTSSYFTSLASIIARRYSAIQRAPLKVIALDCDNTLWGGVCGEDGPLGIEITPAHTALQQFMLEQKAQGMLLCLCSKNVEADVFAVFDQNPNMVIKRADIVATKINWEPKSQNLIELAEELQLGLDSFVFIDDNPIEHAEVAAVAPAVHRLQIPTDDTIPRFLDHAWLFDKLKITEEDKHRAQRYIENNRREEFKSSTTSLRDFLENLDLQIGITAPDPSNLPRLAQLTQRTNQFNATTIRRTESELSTLLESDTLYARIVHLSDRFGDYGLVGMALYQVQQEHFQVETLILSCRALGRGVEHALLKELAQVASDNDCPFVDVAFSQTPKNKPVESFLIHLDPAASTEVQAGIIYRYDTKRLLALDPLDAATPSQAARKKITKVALGTSESPYQEIASSLFDVRTIQSSIQKLRAERPEINAPFAPPESQLERDITSIWEEVLLIQGIGLDDGFKELGGSSLQLVQIHSRLNSTLRKELPLTALFGLPTIRSLITHFTEAQRQQTKSQQTKSTEIQERAARQKDALLRIKELRKTKR